MLLLVVCVMFVNYLDRGNLAIVAPVMQETLIGLAGGLLTFFANLGSALCRLIVGVLVDRSGEFAWGLAYVSVMSAAGAASYLFVVGKVQRIVLAT